MRKIDSLASKAAFVILLMLLGAALFKALLTGYIFWSIIAAWALMIMMAPEFLNAILAQGRSRVATVLFAILFVIYLFLGPARASVTDLDSLLWAIPGNITVFSLVLTTILVVNERRHGHMVRQFLMVVTLISYMTLILLQGPIDHYIGRLMGVDLVPGNTEFMRYFIFSTATGVALTCAMGRYMRQRSFSLINPGGVEWGG